MEMRMADEKHAINEYNMRRKGVKRLYSYFVFLLGAMNHNFQFVKSLRFCFVAKIS